MRPHGVRVHRTLSRQFPPQSVSVPPSVLPRPRPHRSDYTTHSLSLLVVAIDDTPIRCVRFRLSTNQNSFVKYRYQNFSTGHREGDLLRDSKEKSCGKGRGLHVVDIYVDLSPLKFRISFLFFRTYV